MGWTEELQSVHTALSHKTHIFYRLSEIHYTIIFTIFYSTHTGNSQAVFYGYVNSPAYYYGNIIHREFQRYNICYYSCT